MKPTSFILFVLFIVFTFSYSLATPDPPGKNLFYNSKSKYGSCNHCHVGGASAGRWNFETHEIDPDSSVEMEI